MYKLIRNKEGINIAKLYVELDSAYNIEQTETKIKILFPNVQEYKKQNFDENGDLASEEILYKKLNTKTIIETIIDTIIEIDDEGNETAKEVTKEVAKEIEVWEDCDMKPIFDHIDTCIANHDPTPIKPPVTENEKIWDVLNYLISN